MKKAQIIVPWKEGLHMRPAARLVRCASVYRSSIKIMAHGKVSDARSILGILLLCASVGTLLDVEVSGEDEVSAVSAVEQIFDYDDGGV